MMGRMDRYNTSEKKVDKRTNKNKELYKSIYDDIKYSNIEGIETIEEGVVDINQIKDMLKKETLKKEKVFQIPIEVETNDDQEIYDINMMLEIAKKDEVSDNKKRSIDTSNYNYKRKGNKKEENLDELLDDGLFDDLKNTVDIEKSDTIEEIDSTFYTTSMKLNKEDFLDGEEKTSKIPLIISVVVLSILLIGLIIYFIILLKS